MNGRGDTWLIKILCIPTSRTATPWCGRRYKIYITNVVIYIARVVVFFGCFLRKWTSKESSAVTVACEESIPVFTTVLLIPCLLH